MDPYDGKVPPTAPPPYGWDMNHSNVAINQPGLAYPQYPPQHIPDNHVGPQQPLLQGAQQPYLQGPQQPLLQGAHQPLLQGQAQGQYYQSYQSCSGYQPLPPAYPAQSQPVTQQPKPSVVIVGGCPACRIGVLEDDFTCFGVCCAIFCFPIGILCCLAMRQRRCPNCGANFS